MTDGGHYNGEFKNDEDANVDRLRDIAVEGFYEYLDESIDSRNAMMGLLVKYMSPAETMGPVISGISGYQSPTR